jgi:ribosomal protein S18 acetylase RimI-like enzyme
MGEVSIRAIDASELDAVEPLWNALREHHGEVAPHLGAPRERTASWERRRAQYEAWLAEPDSFVLLAERGGAPVGYAAVRLHDGSPTWPSERAGELETLSVLPGERGRGTGAKLVEEVRARLRAVGADQLTVFVMARNTGAIRFYERHAFGSDGVWLRTDLDR